MKPFRSYISYLKTLIADSPPCYSKSERDKRIDMALNGEPNEAIRRSIPRDDLRRYGIFFTNYALANRIINPISASINQNSIIFDPACGTGDLLISCARRLPLASTLEETILNWSKQLHGYDLHSEFILAAKYRLALLAMSRGLDAHQMSSEDIEEAFPRIRQENGLNEEDTYRAASHIIINPPYSMINAPPKCSWASGKVSMAAAFLETCIMNSAPNTRIAAILPDVLRSGSRYFKWRKLIGEMFRINKIEIVGRFNRWVDVDVFIIHLTVGGTAKDRDGDWCVSPPSGRLPKVGDFFEVSVGPVVPHRDPEKGPWYTYIHARTVPPGKVVYHIEKRRRYTGRVFSSPFVVVRRTSSPGDKNRCIGTIINEKRQVAVENHLLVLVPWDKSLHRCKDLLQVLESPKSGEWLNERIRCRHLTVLALRDLPWFIGPTQDKN